MKAIYFKLLSFSKSYEANYVSVDTLMKDLGMPNRKSITNWLNSLEKCGLLEIDRCLGTTSTYRVYDVQGKLLDRKDYLKDKEEKDKKYSEGSYWDEIEKANRL